MATEVSGTGAPGADSAPGTGGTNTNTNTNAAPGDKGVGGAAGGAGTEKTFSYKEDRSDWTPRHRLNEESQRRTKVENELNTLRAELEREQKRTRALVGLDPKDAKAEEREQLRAALKELGFVAKDELGFTKEELDELREAAASARSTSQASWERHALGVIGELETEVAEAMDVEKLTDRQSRSLKIAYREAAQEALAVRVAQARRGERNTLETLPTDKDFIARHEQGDKMLLKEFAKSFVDDWFEPARRSVQTRQQQRQFRPVPRGERTKLIPAGGAQKVDLNTDEGFKKALLEARGARE